MNLEYEANLEDISEPQIRQYLRSKTFKKQRFTEPIRTGLISVATIYLIAVIRGNPMPWWAYLLAFALGYAIIYSTLKDTVTKRMHKYITTELGHKMPATTRYEISGGKISCSCLGSEIKFNLDDLSNVDEDSERLELRFGDIGVCTIPVRAFADVAQKNTFLKNTRREQGGAGQPAIRSESDSEGGDKPQAEAEGRSR